MTKQTTIIVTVALRVKIFLNTKGPWATIRSLDKDSYNSYCISSNAYAATSSIATATRTQIWPYHKKPKVILVSSFEQI